MLNFYAKHKFKQRYDAMIIFHLDEAQKKIATKPRQPKWTTNKIISQNSSKSIHAKFDEKWKKKKLNLNYREKKLKQFTEAKKTRHYNKNAIKNVECENWQEKWRCRKVFESFNFQHHFVNHFGCKSLTISLEMFFSFIFHSKYTFFSALPANTSTIQKPLLFYPI